MSVEGYNAEAGSWEALPNPNKRSDAFQVGEEVHLKYGAYPALNGEEIPHPLKIEAGPHYTGVVNGVSTKGKPYYDVVDAAGVRRWFFEEWLTRTPAFGQDLPSAGDRPPKLWRSGKRFTPKATATWFGQKADGIMEVIDDGDWVDGRWVYACRPRWVKEGPASLWFQDGLNGEQLFFFAPGSQGR